METLRAAFDDSFVAQVIVTPTGQILEVNHQACRVLNRKRGELLELSHKELIAKDEDFYDIFEGLATTFEVNNLQNWQTEQRYVRSDGVAFWASVSVSAIRKEKRVEALLLQLQDITDQKRAEEDLQRNSDDLEQFVYIASHDLREPLIAIAGFASLLRKRYDDKLDDQGKHFLDEVMNGTKRMEAKIDDLLAFSRAGRIGVLHGYFPLGAAIEEARRLVVRVAEESKVSFEIPSDLPIIQGDRGMVAQVFQNLFSNAIKYRGSDTPKIVIKVEPQDENFWLISVSDNGIGFDMQHKDRIFGVFQRLYTVEQYPGTGIGLAIAKKIVERHRGKIWPQSAPGAGTTFYFTLPSAIQP